MLETVDCTRWRVGATKASWRSLPLPKGEFTFPLKQIDEKTTLLLVGFRARVVGLIHWRGLFAVSRPPCGHSLR